MKNKELILAMKAAFAGGEEIMKIYNSGEFEIVQKTDNSPLTIADKNANEVILSFLKETTIPVISEENKELPYDQRKKWSKCWIVDPLDGTKEFIKKNGEFTVNIALIENNKPVLGVIYIPVTETMYFANVKENKSYRVKLKKEENMELALSRADELHPSNNKNKIRVVGSRSHMNTETMDYIDSLKKTSGKEIEIVSKGSSLKFCLVAEGLAEVYPRFAPTMEWDTAAGQAICEAVGIKVIDKTTSEPMLYNRENLLNNYFLVSNLG
ncbi:3'(2'),5'-bisphosphate nucleotidase CysQ [Antarcticibacterium sp. 1MA-6-2]|uniref:3'(2'),5'-bisphosphate nucleotidase CysQ n=1 Tax=Antarcticibacterium sp. 1MA-6-2 TaxID=2908210 RepID=UPI001F44A2ED|nr:3'(2'),5'-bisphosphate nucleotidase CysQ [Antarcticibacterium sp. 1MA-6-2]UJH91283.1 3'(2'),5'-bisphosphate nucleotidase CysQ [Antarcticibacterium sp. 1MA-6-2]